MRRDLIVDGLTLAGGIVAAGLGRWPLWVSAPLAVGCTFSVIVVRRRLGSAVQLRGALQKFWRCEAKVGPWLRRLARMVMKDQPRSGEIRWWDFGPPRPTPARGLWARTWSA